MSESQRSTDTLGKVLYHDKFTWGWYVIYGLVVIISLGIAVIFFPILLRNDVPLVLRFLGPGTGGFIILAIWDMLRRIPRHTYVCEKGVEVISRKDRRIVLWNNVTTVFRKVTIMNAGFRYVSITLNVRGEPPLVIKPVTHNATGLHTAFELIALQTTVSLLPDYQATLKDGKEVSFGSKITLDTGGIRTDKDSVRWSEVKTFKYDYPFSCLERIQKGKKVQLDLRDIPNEHVLLALVKSGADGI